MDVKKLRQKLGLTQKEMGELLGMEGITIRRFEMPETANNHRTPTKTLEQHLSFWEAFIEGKDMNKVFKEKIQASKKSR